MKHKTSILFIVLIASVATISANIHSGTCGAEGDNLTWMLNTEDSTITISGTGWMNSWESGYYVPWKNYRSYIKSCIVEEGVVSIGDFAFESCPNLKEVSLPNSLEWLCRGAFEYCLGITEITIPENVIYISNVVFCGCSGLSSITIPKNVQSIGPGAFDECIGISSVIWNAKNCQDYNWAPFFEDMCSKITSFTFGEDVEYIPHSLCREMTNLHSIVIPDNVKSIGNCAFYGCENLTSLIFGKNIVSVGANAFDGCPYLKNPIYNNYVFAFLPTSYSGKYEIPEGIKTISIGACKNCTNLTSITIAGSVSLIEEGAFSNCNNLTTIIIPASVPVCSWRPYGLNNLSYANTPAWFFDIEEHSWSICPKYIDSLVINNGELNDNALNVIARSYKTLKKLDVSATTNTEFSDEAFKDYYNLEELLLSSSLEKVSYMMVAGCVNLQSIDIPASVVEIDQRAFEDSRSIETITFGGKQPSNKPGLRMATAGESKLRKIGNWAFYNAHELQHLEIPEGVEEIGDGAFYGCTYLQDLVLPQSIKSIGDNCFALCSKLKKITIKAEMPPTIYARTFYDVSRAIPVYVPDDAVTAYRDETYWQEMNIQGEQNNPQSIGHIVNGKYQNGKYIIDGHLYILRDGVMYNAHGVRVE